MSLQSDIRQAERSIAQRRDRISVALDGVTHSVRGRLVSPDVLLAAALFGAALHREHRLNGLYMSGLLEVANSGLQLLLAKSTPARTPATTR